MEILFSLFFSKIINSEVYYLEHQYYNFNCEKGIVKEIQIKEKGVYFLIDTGKTPWYLNPWTERIKSNLVFNDFDNCLDKANVLTIFYYF